MYRFLTKLFLAGVVAAAGPTNANVTVNDTCDLGAGNKAADIDTLT